MNNPLNTIITKILRRATALAAVTLLALTAFAHGGFDHVMGTVSKVQNNVMTVRTAKGDVNVKLSDKTEITKADQQAAVADLKPGSRVVVDIPEGSKDRVAHSVKIGVSAAPAHTHHQ